MFNNSTFQRLVEADNLTGEVVAVNDAVVDAPESINTDAYANWLFKIKPSDVAALDGLLDAAAYGKTTE